jgi:N-acetyltransferase 10
MKKKIDERLRILIENCVKLNQRGLVVLIGDRAVYQIVNLHLMLSKARQKAQPNLLWCYKKDLEYSSHKKKRLK